MGRKPNKLKLAASDGEAVADEVMPLPEPSAPLTPRARLYGITGKIAELLGFTDIDPAEIAALVDEQFIMPPERDRLRFHRQANEMLCQAVERDERFRAAIEIAKAAAE